jgi:hypothetical protein
LFWEKIKDKKNSLLRLLSDLRKEKQVNVVGFGASATTTTLVYEFELTDFLDFVVDDNPIRFGCLLPGTNIEIKSPNSLSEITDGYILVLAWRFFDSIHKKYGYLETTNNMKYILPLPQLRVR